MAGFIEGLDRGQATLFPERLDDLVPADAMVRVLDGFVAGLDLAGLGFVRAHAAGVGRPGYHPGDLLRLYVYGYLNGVRSSRGLEREAIRNLELAWLLRRLQPDFKTIADFRRDNGGAIGRVAQEWVRFCIRQDLVRPTVVAVDGSAFFAVSSRKKARRRSEIEAEIAAHEVEIEAYLADLAEADEADAEAVSEDKAAVCAALAELEEQAAKKRAAAARSRSKFIVIDEPETVYYSHKHRRQPCYNVQLSVDVESQLIVSHEAIETSADGGQLCRTASRAAAVLDQPEELIAVADAGYSSARDAMDCEAAGIHPVFPVMRTVNPHKGFFDRRAFTYDAKNDRMICPAGKPMTSRSGPNRDGIIVYRARQSDCAACPLKPRCTGANGRAVSRMINEDALDRVQSRLDTDPELLQKRKQSVEPVFGTLKRWMHGGRFLLRHRIGANIELALISTAFNINRMINKYGARVMLQALG